MRTVAFLLSATTLVIACSSKTTPPPSDGGTVVNCAADLSVGWTNYALCAAGTGGALGTACPALSPPAQCLDSEPIAACCAWVQDPKQEIARAPSSLHNYPSPAGQTTPDFSCVDTPVMQGTPQMVTLTGYLKVFVGGDADSAGVKIEVFKEGLNASLGEMVGVAAVTDTSSLSRTNDWLKGCPTDGCIERAYTYANIPTETPLIIHTSDALSAGKWDDFYDYNIYFANSAVTGGMVSYDTTAVGSTDPITVTNTVGASPAPDKGLLAGEIHDCGDVRISGATVNTDYRPQGDVFYFGSDETFPLADPNRTPTGDGTSDLGLFGALNYQTGVPIHISAVGMVNGQRKLIGEYVVQVYAGAVTGLAIRGRRSYQHD